MRATKLRGLLLVTALAVGTLLSGCSHDAAGASPTASDSGHAAALTYYLDQTRIKTVGPDGSNLDLTNYKTYLIHCKVPPIKPLSAADEAKVGTVDIKHWQDGNRRSATLTETFGFSMGTGSTINCEFRLTKDANLTIHDLASGRVYQIDPTKHAGTEQVVQGEAPASPAAVAPPDWGALANVGIHKLGMATVKGQPCVIIEDMTGNRECNWSGGHKWGYGIVDGPHITLWETGSPAVRSDVKTLVTNEFMVGRLPGTKIFDQVAMVKPAREGGP